MPARIRVELRQSGWHCGTMAWTVNVSDGGVLLSLAHAPPVGDQVGVSLRLPGMVANEMTAVVRHVTERAPSVGANVRRYEVGAEFVAADSESRGRLDEALDVVRREITQPLRRY